MKKITFQKFFDTIFKEYFKDIMEVLEVEVKKPKFKGIHYRGPDGLEIKIYKNNIELKRELTLEFKKATPMEILNLKPELLNFYFKNTN